MRPALLLLAFAAPLAPAVAQSTLGRVKATTPLRAGPSDKMPACGTLEAGEHVIVHHIEGAEWVAIQPPRGALSWISQLCVEVKPPAGGAGFPMDAVVSPMDGGDVKLAAGSMGEAKPLNVQRTRLPAGTLVRIVGPKVTVNGDDGDSGWYPIVPPRDDFRYLPRSAVETTGTAEKGGFVVKPPPAEAATTGAVGVVAIKAEADANWPTSALWRDAERARAAGDFAKAEELYFKLAKEANQAGDVKLANLCYERVHMVREQARGGAKPAAATTAADGVNWRAGGWSKPGVAAPAAEAVPPPPPAPANVVWGDGVLRRVRFEYQGQKVFALTDQKGQVRTYLVPNGADLDKHVGKWLEVSGAESRPKDFAGDTLLSVGKVESVK